MISVLRTVTQASQESSREASTRAVSLRTSTASASLPLARSTAARTIDGPACFLDKVGLPTSDLSSVLRNSLAIAAHTPLSWGLRLATTTWSGFLRSDRRCAASAYRRDL